VHIGPVRGDERVEPLLVELAAQVLENWRSVEMERRRQLWMRHFRLRNQDKIPVKCAVFDYYDLVWQQLIPEDRLHFTAGLRRELEIQLRIKLQRFARLHDDDVIWPTLWGRVDRGRGPSSGGEAREADGDSLWGLALRVEQTEDAGGAYRPLPPIREEADLERLHAPRPLPRPREEQRLTEEMNALTGGTLPAKVATDELHYGPYEWAVRLRGAQQLLYDAYDRPAWLHRLMARITEGMVSYHRERQALGMFDAEESLPRVHVPYDEVSPEHAQQLSAAWCYAHAQSAASLGPAMYAEFVQPYNARIAALFSKVYYHGCEDLGRKAAIIRDLPHLAYFHVSPWTRLAEVIEALGDRPVVLEVHAHPTEVLFTYNADEMRGELRRRIAEARGTVFDLKLCDIQTIRGAEGKLEMWTDVAMEESVR